MLTVVVLHIFAGAPPLKALRCILHQAATIHRGEDVDTEVTMVNDVSRAFSEAPAMRQVCVELPAEDVTHVDRQLDNVGQLQMSLCGSRDVAMNWQEEVAKDFQTATWLDKLRRDGTESSARIDVNSIAVRALAKVRVGPRDRSLVARVSALRARASL